MAVQFDENNYGSGSAGGGYNNKNRGEARGIIGWLMKIGVAKSEETANKVLIGISVVAILTMIIVLYSQFHRPSSFSTAVPAVGPAGAGLAPARR